MGKIFVAQIDLKYRLFVSGILLASSLWFVYWIYYDMSVWNKSLSQVNSLNYVGLALSAFLILGANLIGRFPRSKGEVRRLEKVSAGIDEVKTPIASPTPIEPKKEELKSQSGQQSSPQQKSPMTQEIRPSQITQQPRISQESQQTIKPQAKPAQPTQIATANPPGCSHSFGYLRSREKSATIPTECITCPQVVKCICQEA